MLTQSRHRAQLLPVSKTRLVLYWVVTVFVCITLIFGALSNFNLVREGYVYGMLDHLGYPRYLAAILGVCKLVATVIFLSSGWLLLKEWAYTGIVILFFGAFVSHVVVGDSFAASVIPLSFGIATIISYLLSPPERRLPL